jgi:hypothetical protein
MKILFSACLCLGFGLQAMSAAPASRGLLQLGQDILARKVSDAGEKGAASGAAAARAEAVQLGRSTADTRPTP